MIALILIAQLFQVTAYHLPGKTFTGTRARRGVCAVDPSVVKLGTVLHIPGYGRAVAADTGKRIRGRRLDVWLPSRGAALRWGVQRLRVRLLRAKRQWPASASGWPRKPLSPRGRVKSYGRKFQAEIRGHSGRRG